MGIVHIGPDYGASTDVDGQPFYLLMDGAGYYVAAIGQSVDVNGSPVIIKFDTPIVPTGNPPTVDAGEVYQAIKAKLPDNSALS